MIPCFTIKTSTITLNNFSRNVGAYLRAHKSRQTRETLAYSTVSAIYSLLQHLCFDLQQSHVSKDGRHLKHLPRLLIPRPGVARTGPDWGLRSGRTDRSIYIISGPEPPLELSAPRISPKWASLFCLRQT